MDQIFGVNLGLQTWSKYSKKAMFFWDKFLTHASQQVNSSGQKGAFNAKRKKHIFDCWFGAGSNGPKPLEESSQHQLGAAS